MELLGNITLHLGDCMDVLKELPGNSFDLALCDGEHIRPNYWMGIPQFNKENEER